MLPRRSLWTLLLGLLCHGAVYGQADEIRYSRQPAFRIPYQIDPAEQGRVREAQLYVFDEHSRSWRPYASVAANRSHFEFRTDRDGHYGFRIRTLDMNGRYSPQTLEGLPPELRIVVDTHPPIATLRTLPVRQDQVGVEWEVRDDNLELRAFQLEYRAQGFGDWQPVQVEGQAYGQKWWVAQIRGPIEVRLRVQDKAGNKSEAQVFLTGAAAGPGLNNGFNNSDAYTQPPAYSQGPLGQSSTPHAQANIPGRNLIPAGPNVKVVNTTNVPLNYGLEDVGPSGVASVELWYSLDGRAWNRYGDDADKTSPFNFQVNGEGIFGLKLLVRSGVGIGDKPPQLGEQPEMWLEVDLTKPIVQLFAAEPGQGAERGNLNIAWSASDKNLGAQPITLLYGETVQGPWQPIADKLENTGRFVWKIPPNAPYKFFVRVEAADRGGNVGRAETSHPIVVDLSHPKGKLLGVDGPVGK